MLLCSYITFTSFVVLSDLELSKKLKLQFTIYTHCVFFNNVFTEKIKVKLEIFIMQIKNDKILFQ